MTRVTLALSGGGAAGFGHIPVLEALDAQDVRLSAIAGTSMGAIVGAAYAAGYSGTEIRDHLVSLADAPLQSARRFFKAARFAWGDVFKPLDPLDALAAILPEDFPKSFEELDIPLTVVATDYHARSEHRFTSGDLRPALAASIAIPGVLRPIRIGGRIYVDGGVTNNLPLDALPSCDVRIAVDVASLPPDDKDDEPSPLTASTGAMRIMMRALLEQRLRSHPPDILIEPESRVFGALEFGQLHEILEAADPAREDTERALRDHGLGKGQQVSSR
jgi:NTE family protein